VDDMVKLYNKRAIKNHPKDCGRYIEDYTPLMAFIMLIIAFILVNVIFCIAGVL
jgi:hypothetical protein